jgi:hypothetical protein
MPPVSSHTPAAPPRPPTFPERALRSVADINLGAAKGVGATALRAVRAIGAGDPVSATRQLLFGGDQTPSMLRPTNAAQGYGAFMGDTATGALAMGATAAPLRALSFVPRVLGNAAMSGGIAAFQGNDPVVGAAVGGGTHLIGEGLGATARAAAGRILRTNPTVAENALRYKAMPGLMRTGDERVVSRLGAANQDVTDYLAGAPGNTPRGFTAGPAMGDVTMNAENNLSPEPGRIARDEATSIVRNLLKRQPARDLYAKTINSQNTPGESIGAFMNRAAAYDARNAVAAAVPGARPGIQKVNDLAQVYEAYRGGLQNMIDPTKVPTIQARIGLGVANRLAGPISQGMYRSGNVLQNPAMRAAMTSILSRDPMLGMPSRTGAPPVAPGPGPQGAAPTLSPEELAILDMQRTRGTTPTPAAAPAAAPADVATPSARPANLSITQPDPERFTDKVRRVQQRMAELGHPVTIVSKGGGRNSTDQAALYAQGRTAPGPIVTNVDGTTTKSTHQLGTGSDLVFVVNGQPSWAENLPWDLLGKTAKAEGLAWGGDWKDPVDRPHVQLYPARPLVGLSPALAERGVPPGGYGP